MIKTQEERMVKANEEIFSACKKIIHDHESIGEESRSYDDYSALDVHYHHVASYEYIFNKNREEFLRCNARCPDVKYMHYKLAKLECPLSLFNDKVESFRNYLKTDMFLDIFYGLAGQNFLGSKRLCEIMIEERFWEFPGSRPPTYYSGHTLFRFMVGDKKAFYKWYDLLMTKRQSKEGQAYQKFFSGLLEKNLVLVQEGIKQVDKAKLRQEGDVHAHEVSSSPIGLVNLSRLLGVWVTGISRRVPEELLITREECESTIHQEFRQSLLHLLEPREG